MVELLRGNVDVRMPIKLCADRVPLPLRKVLPCKDNPAELTRSPASSVSGAMALRAWFSARVSSLTLKGTWRSTRPGRHVQTNKLLARLVSGGQPVIVDIGVSDGVTSLELIEELGANFAKYHVTDRFLAVDFVESGSSVLFFDKGGDCICVAGRWVVFYPEMRRHGRILRWLYPGVFGVEGADRTLLREQSLIQPQLLELAEKDPRIAVTAHDAFAHWPWEGAEVVKVGNLLNRAYFSDPQITSVLRNAHQALRDGGRLVVVENRGAEQLEQTSIFLRQGGGFILEQQIGAGTEIGDLALNFRG